jgi:hypothetical protein
MSTFYTRSDSGTRLEARFEPALDLGLSITTRQTTLVPVLGSQVVLEDPGFDHELKAQADEPRRAAHLFTDSLKRAILEINATNLDLTVTDEGIAVLAALDDRDATSGGLAKVARVATLVDEARGQVPVSDAIKPYSDALFAFGQGRGLGLGRTPVSAAGALRDVTLAVRFVRTGRVAFDLAAQVAPLEGPGAIGLLVRRESMLDRVRTLFGGQDLRTSDPAFDPMFLVRATDGERALAALDGDVRALLLDLAARFDAVTLSDTGLALRGPLSRLRPEDMEMVLEAASTVVVHVARASGAVLRGPYR